MLTPEPIRATEAPSSPHRQLATHAVRHALELLSRASADWRNGGQSPEGPLHWPVAVNLARRKLRQALEIIESASAASATAATDSEPYAACRTNAEGGIAWWNSLTPLERAHWLELADSAVPADAWRAFQAGGSQP